MKPLEQQVVKGPKGPQRRTNRMVEWQGERLCATEFAERIGQRRALVFKRLNASRSVERIADAPDPSGPSLAFTE